MMTVQEFKLTLSQFLMIETSTSFSQTMIYQSLTVQFEFTIASDLFCADKNVP